MKTKEEVIEAMAKNDLMGHDYSYDHALGEAMLTADGVYTLLQKHFAEVVVEVISDYSRERSEYVSQGYKDAYKRMETNLTIAIKQALEVKE